MQLETYIKELLYRYECVIIPGFGAFLTHNESAQVNTATHTFYPPSKRISFNRQLQTNDGLLANYIAKSRKIPYESALQQIRQQASLLKHELSSGRAIEFSKIGSLAPDASGHVIFTPDSSVNYLMSSFGLSSYNSQAVKRAVENKDEKKVVAITQSSTKIPVLRYAAIGLVAIGIASFSGMFFYADGVKQHNLAEKQKATKLLERKIQQATFVVDSPLPKLSITVEKTYGDYHIIAGAFRMEENAATKIAQLTDKGFQARTIGVNKYGLHQVVYGSYNSREEALQQLRHIKTTDNPDAWLLVEKLQK